MMDTIYTAYTRRIAMLLAGALLGLGAGSALAQDGVVLGQPVEDDDSWTLRSPQELDGLVGRIALYPDDLIGIILPASTYPLQVVQAARFLERHETDSTLEPSDEWEDSIVALLNYPQVLAMMNEDLDWTWALGEAVLAQQDDVIGAIQDFRGRAHAAGNLQSDERQVVSQDEGVIEIAPADPEVIYVPYYEPQRVVVYQPAPVIHYYPYAYPVYYYPYPLGYSFYTRHFWGVTTVFSIGWRTRFVHVHHHHYIGHPFYGHRYYSPFYVRQPATFVNVNVHVHRGHNVWRPTHRGGVRPRGEAFVRSDRGTWTRSGGSAPRSDARPRPASSDRRGTWDRTAEARSGDGRPTARSSDDGSRREWQTGARGDRDGSSRQGADRSTDRENAVRREWQDNRVESNRADRPARVEPSARPAPAARERADAPASRRAPEAQIDRGAWTRPQPDGASRSSGSGADRSLAPGQRSSSAQQGARAEARQPPSSVSRSYVRPDSGSAVQSSRAPERTARPQASSRPPSSTAAPHRASAPRASARAESSASSSTRAASRAAQSPRSTDGGTSRARSASAR